MTTTRRTRGGAHATASSTPVAPPQDQENSLVNAKAAAMAGSARSGKQQQPLSSSTTNGTVVEQPTVARYALRKRTLEQPKKQSKSSSSSSSNKGGNAGTKAPAASATEDDASDVDDDASEYSHDEYGYINDQVLNDRDLEALLKEHEANGIRERAEKRQRLDPYPYVPPEDGGVPFDHLPSPCLELVFELLPSPRDIFNLAFLSKHLLSHVERRTEIIVRAAVHENAQLGNKGSKGKNHVSNRIMTKLAELVRKRAIHVPGPLRVLRLVCAERCERGEHCWDYDMESGLSSANLGVQGSDRPFGMALCKKCTEDVGTTIPRWWNHWARSEERLTIVGWSKLIHPTAASDVAPGVGPIIHARHIQQISSTYKKDGVERQQEAFAELVEEVYGKDGSEKYEAYEKAAEQFVGCFDLADEALKAFHKSKDDEKEENRKLVIAKKKETIEPIIEILAEAVEDSPAALKELALDYEWREGDTTNPLRFGIPFVQEKLGQFIRAPSYATQKRVDDAVADIRAKLDILAANEEFYTFSFLSTDADASTSTDKATERKNRVKQKLLNYCQQNLSTLNDLAGRSIDHNYWTSPENYFNADFFDLLEKKRYKTALLRIIDKRGNALNDIVKTVLVAESSSNLSNHRSLALACWQKFDRQRCNGDYYYSAKTPWTSTSFHDSLSKCRTEFLKMKRHAREYLQHQPVRNYLANAHAGGNWNFSREDAINSVWKPRNTIIRRDWHHNNIPEAIRNVKPYELLMNRNYTLLLEVHKYYFSQRSADVHVG